MAGSLEESGDTEAAAHEYERVMELKHRVLGRDMDEVGEMQFSLASLYLGWGNYPRSRELLLECIGTFKRKAGPRLAVAYELLAQVEELSGRFHDAVRELDRAGKVWEKCGNRNTELAANLEYRAELLDQLRRKREAAWLRERAASLTRAAGSARYLNQSNWTAPMPERARAAGASRSLRHGADGRTVRRWLAPANNYCGSPWSDRR